MESVGIILSLPLAFFASIVYRGPLAIARRIWPGIGPVFLFGSAVVLGAITLDWVLLTWYGPLGTRAFVGPIYNPARLITFLLGAPAALNVFAFWEPLRKLDWWFVTAPLASVLAFLLVVERYSVDDALYGIDNSGGPYSAIDHQPIPSDQF